MVTDGITIMTPTSYLKWFSRAMVQMMTYYILQIPPHLQARFDRDKILQAISVVIDGERVAAPKWSHGPGWAARDCQEGPVGEYVEGGTDEDEDDSSSDESTSSDEETPLPPLVDDDDDDDDEVEEEVAEEEAVEVEVSEDLEAQQIRQLKEAYKAQASDDPRRQQYPFGNKKARGHVLKNFKKFVQHGSDNIASTALAQKDKDTPGGHPTGRQGKHFLFCKVIQA
jgi:hypothetical protein